jgi:hypothetical protein
MDVNSRYPPGERCLFKINLHPKVPLVILLSGLLKEKAPFFERNNSRTTVYEIKRDPKCPVFLEIVYLELNVRSPHFWLYYRE